VALFLNLPNDQLETYPAGRRRIHAGQSRRGITAATVRERDRPARQAEYPLGEVVNGVGKNSKLNAALADRVILLPAPSRGFPARSRKRAVDNGVILHFKSHTSITHVPRSRASRALPLAVACTLAHVDRSQTGVATDRDFAEDFKSPVIYFSPFVPKGDSSLRRVSDKNTPRR